MKIHYYDQSKLPAEIALDAVYHGDPSDLLRVSQFLTLHAPETPQTHHFLNSKTIGLLPPGAIVVNTARGGLVVDEDLIAALKSGRVAAAGLDVFEGEPKLNPEYVSLKNAFLLPHIGSATIETRTAMGMLALDNVDAVLNGRPAPTLVRHSRSPRLRKLVRAIRRQSTPDKSDMVAARLIVSRSTESESSRPCTPPRRGLTYASELKRVYSS